MKNKRKGLEKVSVTVGSKKDWKKGPNSLEKASKPVSSAEAEKIKRDIGDKEYCSNKD